MVTQAAEHADEIFRIRVEFVKTRIVEETLLTSDEALADELVERADCQLDEPGKVLPRGSRTSLCDVGRNRHDGTSHLARDTEPLFRRKGPCEIVNKRGQLNRPLPNIELLKVEPSFLFF